MVPGASAPSRRLFFAVRPPEDVVAAVTEFLSPVIASDVSGVTWVRAENYHLTLLFLGPVPASLVETLGGLAARIARTTPAFEATLGTTGCFPNASRPKVAFLELLEPTGALQALHLALVQACRPFVALESRPFHAHLTLARAKRGSERALREAMQGLGSVAPLPYPVSRLELVESLPGAQGVTYRTLAANSLASP